MAEQGNDHHEDAAEPARRVRSERLIGRDCAGCGKRVTYRGVGRPPSYCGPGCRQRAWALRQAEQALGTLLDTRPGVVREVIERVIEREQLVEHIVETPAAAPATARTWLELLTELARQLDDPGHPMARDHWQHQRLLLGLRQVLASLDRAHPGGLPKLGW